MRVRESEMTVSTQQAEAVLGFEGKAPECSYLLLPVNCARQGRESLPSHTAIPGPELVEAQQRDSSPGPVGLSHCPPALVCFLLQTPITKSNLGRNRFILAYRLQSIMVGSQGSNQQRIALTSLLVLACSASFLTKPMPSCLGMVSSIVGCILLQQLAIKTNPHRYAHRGVSSPGVSPAHVCQVNSKISHDTTPALTCTCVSAGNSRCPAPHAPITS